MALMAGTTREESVVVSGAAVAAAPDPEVPGCPWRAPKARARAMGARSCSIRGTRGACDHELQDPPAAAQAADFAAEGTDDLPALCVPEVAGAAGIGCQRERRMVG